MEQFVLGIFQEHLAKYIIGFRKEQVNANLLNGKGEIANVELNCAVLNETMRGVTPYVELESVHISKLSFHVSSWTNLRQAPIVVDIEHITAQLAEPLHYIDDENTQGSGMRQVTLEQLQELIRDGLVPKFRNTSYNILDRILDNLTVEIQSIKVTFQAMGKFKTRRPGPWTPPAVRLQLFGVRYGSVNEFGAKGPPAEMWRHNHGRKRGRDGSFLIYKMLETEYQISMVISSPADDPSSHRGVRGREAFVERNAPKYFVGDTSGEIVIPLVSSNPVSGKASPRTKVECQIAMQRRIRDGEFMAVQVDVTVPVVDIDLEDTSVPLLAHLLAGATYCMAKDRAFEDPLRSVDSASAPNSPTSGRLAMTVSDDIEVTLTSMDSVDDVIENPGSAHSTVGDLSLADGLSDNSSSDGEFESGVDEVSIAEEGVEQPPSQGEDAGSSLCMPINPCSPNLTESIPSRTPNSAASGRPLLVMSNGIVFYDKISFSLSVQNAYVKGTYVTDGNVQLEAKGIIIECMWPQATKKMGGYAQASVAYYSLKEQHSRRVRSLLVGGACYDGSGPVEEAGVPLQELDNDESFPMFENRSIRPDPIGEGIRNRFPTQAIGLKTTIGFTAKRGEDPTDSSEKEIFALNELGIDKVDMNLDSAAWCRLAHFFCNLDNGGFDPRWHTGDWTEALTTKMLLHPSMPLDLEQCIQPTTQMFLDENEFISSDLFNASVKITNVGLKMPADLSEDIQSSDITFMLEETTINVSSALPRTLVGSAENDAIRFPNDPSDIAYCTAKEEDLSGRPNGSSTKSTFRFRLTMRGFMIDLVPVVSSGKTPMSLPLLAPADLTTVCCFEGEPPDPASNSNLTKIVFMTSILAHSFELNVDFYLLASAASTLAGHYKKCFDTLSIYDDLCQEDNAYMKEKIENHAPSSSDYENNRIQSSMEGRKILVRKLVRRSRETGGLSLSCSIQLSKGKICMWRRNIPRHNPVNATSAVSDEYLPIALLTDISLSDFELCIDSAFAQDKRRLMLKSKMTSFAIKVCDFDSLLSDDFAWVKRQDLFEDQNGSEKTALAVDKSMVEILSCGSDVADTQVSAIRVEEILDRHRTWTVAADLTQGRIQCLPEELRATLILIIEALSLPASTRRFGNDCFFPPGTAGEMLEFIVRLSLISDENVGFDEKTGAKVSSKGTKSAFHAFLLKYIPSSVDVVLLRMGTSECLLRVPTHRDSKASDCTGIAAKIVRAEFAASYFTGEDCEQASVFQTYAQDQTTWSSIVHNGQKGLSHRFVSRQSFLVSTDSCNEYTAVADFFDFGYNYDNLKLSFLLSDSIDICDADNLEILFFSSLDFSERCMKAYYAVVESLQVTNPDHGERSSLADKNPLHAACLSTSVSIHSLKNWFRIMQHTARSNELEAQRVLKEKEKEITALRLSVFAKEKARLAALSVASPEAIGWMKYGSAQRTGQRGVMSSTLFSHWVVLRRSLLFMYAGPNQHEIVDIIALNGSVIREVTGGQRKRDIKRAFAVLETTGTAHFFITENDAQHLSWISAIQRAAGFADPSIVLENVDALNTTAHSLEKNKSFDSSSEISNSKHGVPDSIDFDDDASAKAMNSSGHSKQMLRNRLVGVAQTTRRGLGSAGQGTKSRFGSVLHAARQKGKEVAEKRLSRSSNETEETSFTATPALLSSQVSEASSTSVSETWTCQSCMSLNPMARFECQNCGGKRPVIYKGDHVEDVATEKATPENEKFETMPVGNRDGDLVASRNIVSYEADGDDQSDISDLVDCNELDGAGSRLGVKNLLGAAVRRTRANRTDGQTASFPRIKAWQERSKPGYTAPVASLKLRSVSIGDSIQAPEHPFGKFSGTAFSVPLKRLDGSFTVHVKALPIGAEDRRLDNIEEENINKILGSRSDKGDVSTDQSLGDDLSFNHELRSPPDNPSAADGDCKEIRFCINIFDGTDKGNTPSKLIKRLAEIVQLHTVLSEILSTVPRSAFDRCDGPASHQDRSEGMDGNVVDALGLSSLDVVRISGSLLGDLLQKITETKRDLVTQQSFAELTTNFLNSVLISALPIDGLTFLAEFLCLHDASTTNEIDSELINKNGKKQNSDDQVSKTLSILSLVHLCDSDLLTAEKQIKLAEILTNAPTSSFDPVASKQLLCTPVHAGHLSSALHFREAMHSALLRVMEERDDAHARLVSIGVLHNHEIERLQEKNDLLSKELAETKSSSNAGSELNSRAVKTPTRSRFRREPVQVEEIPKSEKNYVSHDMDEELLSLCQQLAREISARTAALLEVTRLKETRKREQELEAKEKNSIRKEVAELKELLELQQKETASARRESNRWKESFERIVKASPD